MRPYTFGTLLGLLVLAGSAAPAAAQTPDTWVSGWAGLYLDPGTVADEQSATEWDLGTSVAFGAAVQRLVGRSLMVGLEVGYSPIRHEVRDAAGGDGADPLASGRAHLLTAMLTGRLGAGGAADFFTYLSGGVGAVTYGIPHLERWDTDFAFRVGPGLEYRHSATWSAYVQWNRWWALHQAEGVDDNTVRHSNLQIGLRYGL